MKARLESFHWVWSFSIAPLFSVTWFFKLSIRPLATVTWFCNPFTASSRFWVSFLMSAALEAISFLFVSTSLLSAFWFTFVVRSFISLTRSIASCAISFWSWEICAPCVVTWLCKPLTAFSRAVASASIFLVFSFTPALRLVAPLLKGVLTPVFFSSASICQCCLSAFLSRFFSWPEIAPISFLFASIWALLSAIPVVSRALTFVWRSWILLSACCTREV